MAFFRTTLFRRRRRHLRSSKENDTIGVWPQVITDVPRLPLNNTELYQISSGGESYIRPNRTALCPDRQRLLQVQRDHNDVMKKTELYLDDRCKIRKTTPIIKLLSNRLKDRLTFRYMKPISLYEMLHARRELRLVKSIRRKLKKRKLVIRPTDKSRALHIGTASDYERKAVAYLTDLGAYNELSSNPLQEILDKVKHLLDDLKSKKLILVGKHYDKMIPDREKAHLAYLYFIPKAHKKDTPLRPIMNTINAPTTGISRLLDKLIRPLFDKYCRSTTIVDGADLNDRLHQYVAQGQLKPTTLFCTFDITDLYTMLPQEESLSILREFLIEHGCEKVNGISIDTIIQLARIVLTENAFVYGDKYYKQIIGGAMGSPFTLTLANIFMWKWQKGAICGKIASNEIFGRYIDDVFFTSNESKETIGDMLKEANDFYPKIKLVGEIGQSITFLDMRIENNNGILSTSVYHKEATEPYVVPFKSDHPRHIFSNIVQVALTRAIRYSSTLKLFDHERRYIKLQLLYNGYVAVAIPFFLSIPVHI
ncbi:unnamed protein product [Rotaria sp. Silwood2]|nr:unnamed protein product [Rotaria sp. Silwood2]CAF4308177.1 unnamed protein product [Rotaria sp. Silwood2]